MIFTFFFIYVLCPVKCLKFRFFLSSLFCLQECAVSGKTYTFNQLRILSRRFAASLRQDGFNPGDVISILLPNTPDYAVVFLGSLLAGMIVSPNNPISTPCEYRINSCNLLLRRKQIVPGAREVFSCMVSGEAKIWYTSKDDECVD